MKDLSLEESRDIIEFLARKIGVNNYKNKSNDELLSAIEMSKNDKPQKSKSKNKERIDIIREELKELNYKLSKGELKEIKKNQKESSRIKKPREYLDKLDEKIRKLEKYYHYEDFEFRGIRNVEDLFKLSISKDYYKPKFVKSGHNNNYMQYESKGNKILTVKEYLGLIEPHLADMINDCKSKSE